MDTVLHRYNFEPVIGKQRIKSDNNTRRVDNANEFTYAILLPDFLLFTGFLSVAFALVIGLF